MATRAAVGDGGEGSGAFRWLRSNLQLAERPVRPEARRLPHAARDAEGGCGLALPLGHAPRRSSARTAAPQADPTPLQGPAPSPCACRRRPGRAGLPPTPALTARPGAPGPWRDLPMPSGMARPGNAPAPTRRAPAPASVPRSSRPAAAGCRSARPAAEGGPWGDFRPGPMPVNMLNGGRRCRPGPAGPGSSRARLGYPVRPRLGPDSAPEQRPRDAHPSRFEPRSPAADD